MEKPFSNSLIHESSPYLLQHAHNPVQWYAWNVEAWNKAKAENKLVIVSVGYSSCHWCHVMEHETFEDVTAAKLMNDHFICIKVDREERPDVDHVYMSAVQLMTGQGGWPLNCICLPDGKPIYGGTYFPNAQWQNVLNQLQDFYSKNPGKAEAYATELTDGIRQMESAEKNQSEPGFSKDILKTVVENWKKHFDALEGGPNRAPKFPMPNNYEFLLHYSIAANDEALKEYVLLTLNKMAFGGIYDQVGGGFARYSTDTSWKVPHFEKMLYDNAQLVSLYSQAFQFTKNELYKEVVCDTLAFIRREMTSVEGGFYSALDADSEGEEGKFYVWTKEELEKLLGKNFNVFADYYNVNNEGLWENDNYILLRKENTEILAKKNELSVDEVKRIISESKNILLAERNKRVRPGLDDKQLTSWNALMIKGYCDAFDAFGDSSFLESAIQNCKLILSKSKRDDGGLNHSYKNGKSSINGYLEDYAFVIQALIRLYECTFEEKYLDEAKGFAEYSIRHFFDSESGMFFFTSDLDPALIVRKKEIHDNVIPASNSGMAKALFLLGKFFDDKNYLKISQAMLHNVMADMPRYGSSFSNWCGLMMWQVYPFYEIVIAGNEAEHKRNELTANYLPGKIIAGATNSDSKLPLLESRFSQGKTLIYVCENYTCKLPVELSEEAMFSMKEKTVIKRKS